MATEKQLEANRQNAQKSTGPKTPEGKAKVSQNAVTHGLTAASPVLSTENPQQYDLFHENLTRQLAPEGVLECFLAERAANLSWRLNRAQRYDTLILDNLIGNCHSGEGRNPDSSLDAGLSTPDSDQSLFGRVLTSDFHNRRTLEKIQRYEFRIERGFYRALKELRNFQSCRLNSVGESRCRSEAEIPIHRETSGPLRNKVGEASVLHNHSVNSKNEKNKANSDSLGSGLSSLDSFAQNKANFPLDIITQIENKRLRSRLLDKKAV